MTNSDNFIIQNKNVSDSNTEDITQLPTVEAGFDKYIITTYYKFIQLDDVNEIKLQLLKLCNEEKIKGTIVIAKEGINSTIAGSREAINNFYFFIKRIPYFSDLTFKESSSICRPFKKLKIKIKSEIVTFKVDVDPNQTGEYLSAEEWDSYLEREDVMVIDTRNDQEIAFGTFKNAINPKTTSFKEFPQWVEENLTSDDKDKKILMFCTGGIRCEKSTAFMRQNGFKNVYHLEGGILKYLETTKNRSNNWIGSCFVFDDRLAVSSDLRPIGDVNDKFFAEALSPCKESNV